MSTTRLFTIAVLVLFASRAGAQILVGPGAKAVTGEEPFPLHGQVSVTQSLGSGTFASTWNPTASSSVSLAPWALLTPTLVLSLNQTYSFEWTESDSTTTPYQVQMSDLAVRGVYLGLRWQDLGLSSLLSASYNIPLSITSRQQGSLGAVGAGARLNFVPKDTGLFIFGGVNVSANPMVAALAQRGAGLPGRPYADRSLGGVNPATCIVRRDSELANFACLDGQFPSTFSARANVGLSWTPPILDDSIFISASSSYGVGFSPYLPSTEGTNNLGYDNGGLTSVNAVDGLVPRQSTSGDLSVGWIVQSWFFLTVGASSSQPLLNARGDFVRFPFWDFVSPYNNFSSLYLDTTFMF